MRDVASVAWRAAVAGLVLVGVGGGAILAASIQGQDLVPGGSIVDGYWVGLLPWMEVGTWLVPIGGIMIAVASILSLWRGPSRPVLRWLTIPFVAVALFWALLVAIGTAPRNAPNGSSTGTTLATFVYSSPLNTILFLLLPAAALLVLATAARRAERS